MKRREDGAWLARFIGQEQRLGEPELTELIRASSTVLLSRGAPLYAAEEKPEGVWIIRSGTVELSHGAGKKRYVVALLRPGDVVADLYLLLGVAPPFTARAAEDTECLFIPAPDFTRLMNTYPSLCVAWLCNFARRLVQSRGRVLEVLGRSLPERVAKVLVQESIDSSLHLPQQTFAQMLGVQRTSLNNVLKRFEAAGLVDVAYGKVRIMDAEGLQRIARGEPHPAAAAELSGDP